MFRLLLVTDRPEVNAIYDGLRWDMMGFKTPRKAAGMQELLQIMQKHRIDAVSFDLPQDELDELTRVLIRDYPDVPVIRAGRNADEAMKHLASLEKLLNRLNEDYSNDGFTRVDILQQCRHEFFRKLLGGEVSRNDDVVGKLMMLRSKMDPDQPCVVVPMSLPAGDRFLSDRWRYGYERLELALRNILGTEMGGMHILVSVLPDEEIYLLAYPMRGSKVDVENTLPKMQKHVSDAIVHIKEYLGLELVPEQVTILPTILELTAAEE